MSRTPSHPGFRPVGCQGFRELIVGGLVLFHLAIGWVHAQAVTASQSTHAIPIPEQLAEARSFYEKTTAQRPETTRPELATGASWVALSTGALVLLGGLLVCRRLAPARVAFGGSRDTMSLETGEPGLALDGTGPSGSASSPHATGTNDSESPEAEPPLSAFEQIVCVRQLVQDLSGAASADVHHRLDRLDAEFGKLERALAVSGPSEEREWAVSLQSLIRQLREEPERVTASTVRTLAVGVDHLRDRCRPKEPGRSEESTLADEPALNTSG